MSGMTKKVWGEAAGKGPYTGMPRVDILLKAIDKKIKVKKININFVNLLLLVLVISALLVFRIKLDDIQRGSLFF